MNVMFKNHLLNQWVGFLVALGVFITTVWFSNFFVTKLKKEEQKQIETYAKVLELRASEVEMEKELDELLLFIQQNNNTIPTILLDENDEFSISVNIDGAVLENTKKLNSLINQMKLAHNPIEIQFKFGRGSIIYENSKLLTQLQYYPVILMALIALFLCFSFWYFKTLKNTQQSFLWAGMAKETAHQIGTPLSSLWGWIELLKLENIAPDSISEMERDVNRLNQIAERFSKIGSTPELKEYDIVAVAKQNLEYLQTRTSRQVVFEFLHDRPQVIAPINKALFNWVIENLVKNAADAIQNKGKISLEVKESKRKVEILISDTGNGIPKNYQKRIFEPGFTTKKRGWGLGLSLVKRIIHSYHKGKISILQSDRSGTVFKISLNRSK